jgi:hypothetical protein
MTFRGLRRFGPFGLVLAAAGLTLLSRAVSNVPIAQLAGLEGAERTARQG